MGGGRRWTIDDVTEWANGQMKQEYCKSLTLCFGTRRKTVPYYPEKQGLVEGRGTDLCPLVGREAVDDRRGPALDPPVTVAGHAYRCVLRVYTYVSYQRAKRRPLTPELRPLHFPSVRSRVFDLTLAYSRNVPSITRAENFPGPPGVSGREMSW